MRDPFAGQDIAVNLLAEGDVTGDRQEKNTPLGDNERQPCFVVEAFHNNHFLPPKIYQIQQSYYTQNRVPDASQIPGSFSKALSVKGLPVRGFDFSSGGEQVAAAGGACWAKLSV